MAEIYLKEESFKIIGLCMEVHRQLGIGFKERVYKDALEMEFKEAQIPFLREKEFKIEYKGIILNCSYFADFIIFNSIILEVKATDFITDNFVAQTINYLKFSGVKLGIIGDFGKASFEFKRVVF
jgi:GxxExxY protein